jgi:hypothetical protein
MNASRMNINRAFSVLAFLILGLLMLVGCSRFDAPTASQPTTDAQSSMWNPNQGDMINGHEVPIVNSNYWESLYGPQVNPAKTPPVSAVIGREGGTLRLGPHMLEVPAGAVDADVTFTLTYASMSGIAVDCGPSPFRFNIPVTLTLSYMGTQYANTASANSLGVFYMSTTGGLELEPSTVDVQHNSITAKVDHFSRYIIAGISR